MDLRTRYGHLSLQGNIGGCASCTPCRHTGVYVLRTIAGRTLHAAVLDDIYGLLDLAWIFLPRFYLYT